MRPTLRQLQYLVAVCDLGKFGEAARKLRVSQPSLSAQIADVEATLGVKLIERGRSGAVPTPLGKEVVERARRVLRDVEDLKSAARRGGKDLAGRISLGVLPTVGPYLLPGVVRRLHADFPSLRLTVREERSVDLDLHLADGRFDCVVSRPDDHPGSRSRPIFREDLYVCVAPEDPLAASAAPVLLGELEGREMLSLGEGHGLTAVIRRIAAEAGATVSTEYEGTSLDAVRQTALMGTGVAVFPSLYALREALRDPEMRVRRIDHPLAFRRIALVWRETSPLGAQFETIAAVLENEAASLLDRP
ncbi:MAG: hydrogen peroxide-inducible genes activator [Parvularculaceae bacterium]